MGRTLRFQPRSSLEKQKLLAPDVLLRGGRGSYGEVCMNGPKRLGERRKWSRLPLAIPVFVRSHDGKGKEFLEFATSLNVSAGGMLVAIRRSLPAVAQVRLEIPSAPVAAMAMLPGAARTLRARTLRTTPADGYYLLGLKFTRPLPMSVKPEVRQRKLVASV
jgi:PilZ domain